MESQTLSHRNPLAMGFYTVPEAARLVEVGSARRIYGWLKGYSGRRREPLLVRDYEPLGGNQELSFYDLIEVHFVEHFRFHGVKMKALRLAADNLRIEFQTPHPFATARVYFIADKADVFIEIMQDSARQVGDGVLMSLTNKNYVMRKIIADYLVPGIEFDPDSGIVSSWAPRPHNFPDIVIDPTIAYGQPAGPSRIPTAAIYDAWIGEGEDVDEAAYWLDIPPHEVVRAVAFERALNQRGAIDSRGTN